MSGRAKILFGEMLKGFGAGIVTGGQEIRSGRLAGLAAQRKDRETAEERAFRTSEREATQGFQAGRDVTALEASREENRLNREQRLNLAREQGFNKSMDAFERSLERRIDSGELQVPIDPETNEEIPMDIFLDQQRTQFSGYIKSRYDMLDNEDEVTEANDFIDTTLSGEAGADTTTTTQTDEELADQKIISDIKSRVEAFDENMTEAELYSTVRRTLRDNEMSLRGEQINIFKDLVNMAKAHNTEFIKTQQEGRVTEQAALTARQGRLGALARDEGVPVVDSQDAYDALPSGARYREEANGPIFTK